MWVMFIFGAMVTLIMLLVIAYIGNKVWMSIKKSNAELDVEIENIKENKKEKTNEK